jgi:hypothetical protein
MTSVVAALTPLLLLAALAIGGLTLLSTRRIQVALSVFADLLLVVGLLRLSAIGSWQTIGSAAALVAVRKIATYGIARAVGARSR